MALIQAELDAAPWVLCQGTPAVTGDTLIIVLDPEQFPDAEDIVAEIVDTEQVTTNPRGCSTSAVCSTRYTVEFDDSLLPEGIVTLQNCYVGALRCADCCEVWRRQEIVKIILQPDALTEADFYTQIRTPEIWDLYGWAVTLDFWPDTYGAPLPLLDVTVRLRISDVNGNSATTDIAGSDITLLRATPELYSKITFPSPIRIPAGSQLYVEVVENGGTTPPEGLGAHFFYRLPSIDD